MHCCCFNIHVRICLVALRFVVHGACFSIHAFRASSSGGDRARLPLSLARASPCATIKIRWARLCYECCGVESSRCPKCRDTTSTAGTFFLFCLYLVPCGSSSSRGSQIADLGSHTVATPQSGTCLFYILSRVGFRFMQTPLRLSMFIEFLLLSHKTTTFFVYSKTSIRGETFPTDSTRINSTVL